MITKPTLHLICHQYRNQKMVLYIADNKSCLSHCVPSCASVSTTVKELSSLLCQQLSQLNPNHGPSCVLTSLITVSDCPFLTTWLLQNVLGKNLY